MTKSEQSRADALADAETLSKGALRKQRKAARAAGQTTDLDRAHGQEFTESARGYRARYRWAKRYDDLNGAPESDYDR